MSLCHLLDALPHARDAEFPSVLIDPAALFGIAAALVAFFAVLNQEPFARGLAIAAGGSVAVGFTRVSRHPGPHRSQQPILGTGRPRRLDPVVDSPDGDSNRVVRGAACVRHAVAATSFTRKLDRREAVADLDHPQRSLRSALLQFPPRSGRRLLQSLLHVGVAELADALG
jgi:hypothetical protein